MDYTRLGTTGLQVSRICLGCMGFGTAEGWVHNSWALDAAASRPIIKQALELGINFFDTANVYATGASEAILGPALKDFAKRDEVIIATKVHGRMRPGPNGGGLSRKHILNEIDDSLRRLQTDYVDLYQIHRWDYETPIEETMETLNDVVRAGKARYIGASAMFAWHLGHVCLAVSEGAACRRAARLDAVCVDAEPPQPDLSRRRARDAPALPRRRDRRDPVQPARLRPAHARLDIRENGAFRDRPGGEVQVRHDGRRRSARRRAGGGNRRATRGRAYARRAGLAAPEAAGGRADPVAAPIIGATKTRHLDEAIGALSLKLTAEEIAALEAPYVPHRIVGHQ